MFKVFTSVLSVLLLRHTLNDPNSLSGSICSATAMFSSTRFELSFTMFFLILQTVATSDLLTFLLLKKGFFLNKGLKTD